MKRLSIGQRKVAAEIIGNIAVTWFAGGVISPIFVRTKTISEFAFSLILGLITSLVFARGAISLVKGVKT